MIYMKLYATSLSFSLPPLFLSFSQFRLRHSTIRSSISTSVYCSSLGSCPFVLPKKKNRASSSRSYDCSLQRFLFLLRDFRRFISGRTRRNHGDLIVCFPFFTIALFKFLRFLPYNRMPRPRFFCANDEDGEYTTTVLPKRPPSPVRFVTRYLNRVVSVLK